jgi:hypothetical protein
MDYDQISVSDVKPGNSISLVRGPDEEWRTAHQVILSRHHVLVIWEGGYVGSEFHPKHVVWRQTDGS